MSITISNPPAWFFGAIAGSIIFLILLLGLIAGMIKYLRAQRRQGRKEDLENNANSNPSSFMTPLEMAERNTGLEDGGEFVDVDLRDPVVRNQSVYTRVRDSLSLSISRGEERGAFGGVKER